MSGGHFDYKQHSLGYIAEEIEDLVADAGGPSDNMPGYASDILQKFQETARQLRILEAKVRRIDWLVSGDDGEESFRRRWAEETGEEVGASLITWHKANEEDPEGERFLLVSRLGSREPDYSYFSKGKFRAVGCNAVICDVTHWAYLPEPPSC